MKESPKVLVVIYISMVLYAAVRSVYFIDAIRADELLMTDSIFKVILIVIYLLSFRFIWKQNKNSYYTLIIMCFIPAFTLFRFVEVFLTEDGYLSALNLLIAFGQCIPIIGGLFLLKESVREYYGLAKQEA